MEEFIYDDNATFEGNFYRWYSMNCKERSQFNEPIYRPQNAKKVFTKLWGNKQHGRMKQLVLF